jgi:hypothetical protein
LNTNRDLYKGIEGLLKQKQDQPLPSLEAYLTALIRRAGHFANKESISLDEFFSLLRDAFDGPGVTARSSATAGFLNWQLLIEQQIEDLQRMAQNGQLQEKYRDFGIDAPSGRRWFNFDPLAYIECGAAGSLGGWMEGDKTGRTYVPGKVAYEDPGGDIQTCDPRDLDRPPLEIPEITWEMFLDFAWCGQNYE